jgi:hypothetical protein
MSTLKLTTLQNAAGNQSVSQTTIYSGTAKAWSNLDGTGTIAERDSFNISSYTDNGTGSYTKTISNDMADANYAVAGKASTPGTTNGWQGTTSPGHTAGAFSATCLSAFNSAFDGSLIVSVVHGDLA